PYSRDRKSRSRSSACQRATASVNTAGSATESGTAQAVCRTASGHGRVTVTAVSSREPGCVATPSMRETAVPAPEILYMNEYAIYNLIWIEIRLKLKLMAARNTSDLSAVLWGTAVTLRPAAWTCSTGRWQTPRG